MYESSTRRLFEAHSEKRPKQCIILAFHNLQFKKNDMFKKLIKADDFLFVNHVSKQITVLGAAALDMTSQR